MSQKRRKCKLSDKAYKHVDLRQYESLITDTINEVVPGKNPKVYEEYFSTDELNQSEAVLLGRALAKVEELKGYGKTVTIFRLFEGKTYDSEKSKYPTKKRKGGHM